MLDEKDHARRVKHTNENIAKVSAAIKRNAMKEHEHPYWGEKKFNLGWGSGNSGNREDNE